MAAERAMGIMSIAIALLVGAGLIIYVLAAFVAASSSEPGSAFVARLRHCLAFWNKLTPLFLAVIWIGYGLLHFLFPELADEQMPGFVGQARAPLWAASGAFEIAIGLLVLNVRWRRLALLAQLTMLVLLTPFVIYLLSNDGAMGSLLPGLPPSVARVVLVFHNLLLFVWTFRAYREEVGRPSHERSSQAPGSADSAFRFRPSAVLVVAAVMLAANLAGFLAIASSPWRPAVLSLWAMGSLATGALVGFLFGVPRWVASRKTVQGEVRKRYQPNTNIEKLSDWLTATLVGVGLVQLHALGPALVDTGKVLANGLTIQPGSTASRAEAEAFAIGLVAYFAVAGLIQGFLLTRMYIARAWETEVR